MLGSKRGDGGDTGGSGGARRAARAGRKRVSFLNDGRGQGQGAPMQTALEQAAMEAMSASAAESVGGDVRGSVASIVHSAQLDDVVFFETSSAGVAGDDGNDDDIASRISERRAI